MLDNHGFNLWAGDYDEAVEASDDDNTYPFAGYKDLMNVIYGTVMSQNPTTVLDIGIGTGTLTFKLYESGIKITGIDFSDEMLAIVREKMPTATLIKHDFTKGMPAEVRGAKYDFIISTYALHHLTDDEKVSFLLSATEHLNNNGKIIIGDVSFQNKADLDNCKISSGDEWDDDEFYFIFTELEEKLKDKYHLTYRQISHCAGILEVSSLHHTEGCSS